MPIRPTLLLWLLISFGYSAKGQTPSYWLTDPKLGVLFQKQSITSAATNIPNEEISLYPDSIYQSMDGFGFTLTQGSAQHLLEMSEDSRKKVLKELFGNEEKDIRISYLRLSVAASDLNKFPFSYNDLKDPNETDPSLTQFSLSYDTLDVVPILKQILAMNPKVSLMASPWSPPTWMKDNKDTRGGSLLPQFEASYANYLVKYIQEMGERGIRIDALTIQNEPLHPGNNPSLLMLADQQARFIGEYLGPAFQKAGISTKIITYDHNANRPDYPITVLSDPKANPYIDGSAFHLYEGKMEALSEVHQAFPDKHIYFTEQWVGSPGNLEVDIAWHVKNLLIGAPRNWAKTVLEWNLSSNPELTPHTDRGGCYRCLGAITISDNEVVRNPAYYVIAHASKLVDPGSKRIGSSESKELPNVAFIRPDGRKVLIVHNDTAKEIRFAIKENTSSFPASLPSGATGTWLW
ncbi:MAG: glucosylceramidase [Bacteroidetes bacterium]|nr:glucosylceramidase [Bacteroidota bacterium]MDA1268710.1 glucosylceramidase [Bacteroidota bacterium]